MIPTFRNILFSR